MPRAGRGLPGRRGYGVRGLSPPARGILQHMRGAQGATCLAGQMADVGLQGLRPRVANSGKRRNEVNKETIEKLGGIVTKVTVSYDAPKTWSDAKDASGNKSGISSPSGSFGIEADVTVGANLDDLSDAIFAYCKVAATRNLKAEPNPEAVAAAMNIVRGIVGDDDAPEAFGPPTPAKEESEEGHTRIARFTLNHAGDAMDDKFKLELYPRIGDKPGKWPELKFTGTREAVWGFIGPEWDNDWKLPCDKTVDWLADWKLGREKTGEKAKPGSRYKDLIAIHGA